MNKKIIKPIILLIIFILIISNVNVVFSTGKEDWENWLKNNKATLDLIVQKGYGATGNPVGENGEKDVFKTGIIHFNNIYPDSSWDSTSIENAIKYGTILGDYAGKYDTNPEMFGDGKYNRDTFDVTMAKLKEFKNTGTTGSLETPSSSENSENLPYWWNGEWTYFTPDDIAKYTYDTKNFAVFERVCQIYMNPKPDPRDPEETRDTIAEMYIKNLTNIMNQPGMKSYLQTSGLFYNGKLVDILRDVAKKRNDIKDEDAKKALKDIGAPISESGGNVYQEKEEEEKKSESIYNYPGQDKTNSAGSLDDMIGDADKFIDSADDAAISTTSLQEFSKTFYNIFLTVGIIVATLVGSILGIKFMLGGAEEKAHIKELLVPYIVGCIVIFGAFAIWKIVVTILSNSLA